MPLSPLATGLLVGGSGSAFGGIVNGIFSTANANKANEEARKNALLQQQLNNSAQVQTMQYNSAPNQVRLAKEAGLNPASVTPNSATSPLSTNAPQTFQSQQTGFEQFGANLGSLAQLPSTIENVTQNTALQGAQTSGQEYTNQYINPATYNKLGADTKAALKTIEKMQSDMGLNAQQINESNERIATLINDRKMVGLNYDLQVKRLSQELQIAREGFQNALGVASIGADALRYSADKSAQASMYGSSLNYLGSTYNTDKMYENGHESNLVGLYGHKVNRLNSLTKAETDRGMITESDSESSGAFGFNRGSSMTTSRWKDQSTVTNPSLKPTLKINTRHN